MKTFHPMAESEKEASAPKSIRALQAWKTTQSRPLVAVIGTRAQLIKMAPLLRELERRHHPCRLILTGQHHATMQALLDDFGIAARPEYVYRGREVSGIGRMALWLPLIVFRLLRRRQRLFRDAAGERALVLVHGDTFSTLAGALAGRLAGCPLAHVESGLRSFSLLNPFPEELTRLLVFRLTDIAFCPGEWAAGNMAKYPLEVVDTCHNTLLDSVRLAARGAGETDAALPARYCVASIHRFENIFFHRRLVWIVRAMERIARDEDVVFVMHPATVRRLEVTGLMPSLADNPRIHLRQRMAYAAFIRLLRDAAFVVTDGGSNQEELHYLGKATLLLRNATERQEGLAGRAVLCRFSDDALVEFLRIARETGSGPAMLPDDVSPCELIANILQAQGSEGGA